jgi:hypothetical protein
LIPVTGFDLSDAAGLLERNGLINLGLGLIGLALFFHGVGIKFRD